MLTFQTDIDEASGEQVLTCFLLPQLEYQNEQQGMMRMVLITFSWASTFISLLYLIGLSSSTYTVLFSCGFFGFTRWAFYTFCYLLYNFIYWNKTKQKGAPALLRRWGGRGPVGWRANISPWFRSPLFDSSFSIDDGFGTLRSLYIYIRIVVESFFSARLRQNGIVTKLIQLRERVSLSMLT